MTKLKPILLTLALLVFAPFASAQTPAAELAQPPADAETWAIVSTAGQHGTSRRWTAPDGVRWARENIVLRGFVTDIDQQMRLGEDGSLLALTIRGVTPSGDAAESFALADGQYRFQSPVDRGEGAMPAGAIYGSFGGAIDGTIAFVDALRRAPNQTLALLPSGQAQLQQLTTHQVSANGETKTLTAYAITGLGLQPFPVWYDGDRFFASVGFLSWIPAGWEGVVEELSAAQTAALSTRGEALVGRIAPPLTQAVVFQNVRIFDAANRAFRDGISVVVEDGRITRVGRARSVRAPRGARIVPGEGRTLVPGLWDAHMHFGSDNTGPLLLSLGVTSVRDPGNRAAQILDRRARINSGRLLGPRVVASQLIDGEGPNMAQMAEIVRNLDEGLAAIRRADERGFFGVKLYGTLDPALVAPMAAEAHRLGLRVHGHIPQGLRPLDAVRAGYDEITHINWVMMQAAPDAIINNNNGLERFYGPARFGPEANFSSGELAAFIAELAQRGITVDPTVSTFEALYVPLAGEMPAAYAPYAGTLPSQLERGMRAGGLLPTEGVSRERMREAQAALVRLVGTLHAANVPIVAGTDGIGLELVRELELYVEAGLTPAEALATATIIPARIFAADANTGAIAVGAAAELALVEGDPSQDIGELRNVVMVMRDNRLMDAAELRSAVGISGPPQR